MLLLICNPYLDSWNSFLDYILVHQITFLLSIDNMVAVSKCNVQIIRVDELCIRRS